MYAAMYKQLCNNPCNKNTKVNIYTNPAYSPLPVKPAPIAPSMQLYYPVGACGQPYPTPMYHPPYCCCAGCVKP